MQKILIYSKSYCPYCSAAKELLKSKNIEWEERQADGAHADEFFALVEKHNHQTVPMIFIGERFIGGFDSLAALDAAGELDAMLAN